MINEIIKKLENKSIAILGFGREGISTYEFIRKYLNDIPLTILDKNSQIKDHQELKNDKNVKVITGDNYLENLENYDCIIKTPGISLNNQDITQIKDKITSQLELLLEVNSKNVIGITGTKGKSTTSSLIYEMIKIQNSNTLLAGNIGTPIFSILDNCDENTTWVIEMSSHQLEFVKKSPHIGIILNLFEDHLDHAKTVEHYHNCKLNMFAHQTEKDIMIYCSDNETLNKLIKESKFPGQNFTVNLKGTMSSDVYSKNNIIYFHDKPIYNTLDDRKLLGDHNLENIMVALLVNEILHLSNEGAIKVVNNFKPLAYRLENIGEVENVTYVMDTLATIPQATIEAITTLKKVNTLIFGGLDRGISYEAFIEYLNNSSVEHFICMPTTGHEIGKKLPKEKTFFVNSLEEAVTLAKKITKKNTICLLSPAASSYDQFKNYQEKGDKFKEYVLNQEKNN